MAKRSTAVAHRVAVLLAALLDVRRKTADGSLRLLPCVGVRGGGPDNGYHRQAQRECGRASVESVVHGRGLLVDLYRLKRCHKYNAPVHRTSARKNRSGGQSPAAPALGALRPSSKPLSVDGSLHAAFHNACAADTAGPCKHRGADGRELPMTFPDDPAIRGVTAHVGRQEFSLPDRRACSTRQAVTGGGRRSGSIAAARRPQGTIRSTSRCGENLSNTEFAAGLRT